MNQEGQAELLKSQPTFLRIILGFQFGVHFPYFCSFASGMSTPEDEKKDESREYHHGAHSQPNDNCGSKGLVRRIWIWGTRWRRGCTFVRLLCEPGRQWGLLTGWCFLSVLHCTSCQREVI